MKRQINYLVYFSNAHSIIYVAFGLEIIKLMKKLMMMLMCSVKFQ